MSLPDIPPSEVSERVLGLILYGLLPLWVIAGFVDWYCHRKTRIEHTSGLKESVLHLIMAVQVAVPMWLAILFKINVLIMLMIVIVLIWHELVAHHDVSYTTGKRKISIWEAHAHSFLETVPFFIAALVICINWDVFMKLITFDWADGFSLDWRQAPIGKEIGSSIGTVAFIRNYFILVVILGVFPYAEEFVRCFLVWRRNRASQTSDAHRSPHD